MLHRNPHDQGVLKSSQVLQLLAMPILVALQVGKHDDPATARRGETLYEFVPRSVVGHLRDGSAMERQRLSAKGIAPWSPRSRCDGWPLCGGTYLSHKLPASAMTVGHADIGHVSALH